MSELLYFGILILDVDLREVVDSIWEAELVLLLSDPRILFLHLLYLLGGIFLLSLEILDLLQGLSQHYNEFLMFLFKLIRQVGQLLLIFIIFSQLDLILQFILFL